MSQIAELDGSPFLSVIVPVYNGSRFLERCLDALFRSDYRLFELIIVDDCSTDNTAELSRTLGATVLQTPSQSGPAAARNMAAHSATGQVLVFVDADVVVRQDTLGRIARRFMNESSVAAVFGSYDDEPAEPNFLSQYKNLQHHFVHQYSNPVASTFWSGLGAMRREIFLSHGGFDCELFSMPSIEDIELGVRVRAAGHRIVLDKDIQAKHLKRWELLPLLRTEIFRRALPWSKLILERQGLINDMNLRTSDRLSAFLLASAALWLILSIWRPIFGLFFLLTLTAIAILNRKILVFFARKRGLAFAVGAYFWQLLYFFYSGVTFVGSCLWFSMSRIRGTASRNTGSESRRDSEAAR